MGAILFLLKTFLELFAIALLLRFYLQVFRAPGRNPLSTFLIALTNWIVVPARRVIPGLWRIDLSTLVLAWLTEVLLLLAVFALLGGGLDGGSIVLPVLVGAALRIVTLSLYILMFAVIALAVLSWVAPYSPAMPLLNSLTRPFLLPFQRRIPLVGGVDMSPFFLFIIIWLLLYFVGWLEAGVVPWPL